MRPESPCRTILGRPITFLHSNHYDDPELQLFVTNSFTRLPCVLGRAHLAESGVDAIRTARIALKNVVLASIVKERELPKLSLYLRLLADLRDFRALVQFATDELFHEFGVVQEITPALEQAAATEDLEPSQRFAALDGLVFNEVRQGQLEKVASRLEVMASLVDEYGLDNTDRATVAMKQMLFASAQGKADVVAEKLARVAELMPDNPEHQRIFRYNAAVALFKLGHCDAAASETERLIEEYYRVLALTPAAVMMKNPDEILRLIRDHDDPTDDLKHLADTLDLHAMALDRLGRRSGLARIHAVKFYAAVNALDSVIRVGQDLADEFIARHDYVGAREVMERNVLPNVIAHKLLDRLVPVRAQYAVILAYCGEHPAAETEMARLAPYVTSLNAEQRREFESQRSLIMRLRRHPPPPQWEMPPPPRKIGRNELCYCGSRKKYKRCHAPIEPRKGGSPILAQPANAQPALISSNNDRISSFESMQRVLKESRNPSQQVFVFARRPRPARGSGRQQACR